MAAVKDPEIAAREARLHYGLDDTPGITRRRCGKGFTYHHASGRTISRADRERIDALAIPPAWTDVWISRDPRVHLQATGRDDRERKQYRYHDEWHVVRDREKFDQLVSFGQALPAVRRAVEGDLRRRKLDRRKVAALLVRLLDTTPVRIGNEEYAEENETYGLTTLRPQHALANTSSVTFCFVGKSGAEQELQVRDRRIASLIKSCRALGGDHLFMCCGDDAAETICSDDVNDYLHDIAGELVTARDFRTWGATAEVAGVLGLTVPPDDERPFDAIVLEAIDRAADRLGNTRTVCRNSYVHPSILEAFGNGSLAAAWRQSRQTELLTRAERTVLRSLTD